MRASCPDYPASHGCIRLPREFAQRLWGITRLGARVIIAQDEVIAQRDFEHARLFTALGRRRRAERGAEPARRSASPPVAGISTRR